MKRLALALAALLSATPAAAQSQLPPSTIWGNFATVSDYPAPEIVPACSGALTFTAGTGFGCGPGAVNLIPLNNTWTGINTFTRNTAIGAAVPPDTLLTINQNTGPSVAPPYPETAMHVMGADGTSGTDVLFEGFGAGSGLYGRAALGTRTAPLPLTAGKGLFSLWTEGFSGGTSYQFSTAINATAAETFSTGHAGGYLSLWTTPIGTYGGQEALRVQPSGGLAVGTASVAQPDPGNGVIWANALRTIGVTGVTVKPINATQNASLTIDTSGPSLQSSVVFNDNSVVKWVLLRQTDNTLQVYDAVASRSDAVWYQSGGVSFATAGGMGDPGFGNVAAGTYKSALGTVVATVASGQFNLNTTTIASASCSAPQTATATGTVTTDTVIANFAGDPTGITGYIPSTSGMLTIFVWPVSNGVDFKACNNTAAAITPGVVTVNWRVAR